MSNIKDFYIRFEKRVEHLCNDNCTHYYRELTYKDKSHHYRLYCVEHNEVIQIPRKIAVANILDGAMCVSWEDGKQTRKDLLKRTEALTS